MPASPHLASLRQQTPQFVDANGSIAKIQAADLPVLKGLSIRRLTLAPQAVREPHWHANAHELGYCLRGEHLVTIAGSHSTRDSFTVSPGEMFFVPSGALHHIENVGEVEGEFILGFSHEQTEDFGLSGTFGAFTDAVLANTVGLPASAFAGLDRAKEDVSIGRRTGSAGIEETARHLNPHKLALEAMLPQIQNSGGLARTAQTSTWPILKDIAMFSLRIADMGMREIHWHPETAEMGYVTAGTGRMTILNPGGEADTYTMEEGDVYFIPRAYPHHIENVGTGDLSLLVFFDQSAPGDIGGWGAVNAYSPEVLGVALGVDAFRVPAIPFVMADPLIVPRLNPVDR